MRRFRGIVAAACLAGVVSAGCSNSHPSPRSAPASELHSPASPTPVAYQCSGAAGEALLRRLLDMLSAGQAVPLRQVFAPRTRFTRWWDPSVPAGQVIGYSGLGRHLEKIEHSGLAVALQSFRATGFAGAGTGDEGGWFTFTTRLLNSNGPTHGHGKGAVDCQNNRLRVVVIDSW